MVVPRTRVGAHGLCALVAAIRAHGLVRPDG